MVELVVSRGSIRGSVTALVYSIIRLSLIHPRGVGTVPSSTPVVLGEPCVEEQCTTQFAESRRQQVVRGSLLEEDVDGRGGRSPTGIPTKAFVERPDEPSLLTTSLSFPQVFGYRVHASSFLPLCPLNF